MSPEDTLDMYIGMTGSVWIMLYALALENILKGIIALREGANLYGGTKKTLTAKSHKLVPLAERSGVKPTSEETDLLEELSTYSIWRGKFFIPLSAEELSDFETQLQGKRRLRGRPTEMKEILDALLLKVMTAYTQHREEFDTKEKPDD